MRQGLAWTDTVGLNLPFLCKYMYDCGDKVDKKFEGKKLKNNENEIAV